jgi:hypothetical protein
MTQPPPPIGAGIAVRPTGTALTEQLTYAKALATADLLPKAYRGQPANLLLALAYGDSLHLNISQVLNGINVIEGKPSMGAELMSALTRQAGHRIRVSGNDESATCSIWRSDDPEFEYASTWTVARAVQAKLCGIKDGKVVARSQSGKPLPWETYTAAMLRARAISEACRMAVPDVLSGVSYTPEELEEPRWVEADPDPRPQMSDAASSGMGQDGHRPPTAATVPKQRGRRKASATAPDSDVVEADSEPSKSDEAPEPPTQTGDLSIAEAAEAEAEQLEWRAVWLGQLDEAIEGKNLDAIQGLGTAAAQAGADDLVEDARNAWSIVTAK